MAKFVKKYPRAEVRSISDIPGYEGAWQVVLVAGPVAIAEEVGDYNNWLWAMVEAIAAVKKARTREEFPVGVRVRCKREPFDVRPACAGTVKKISGSHLLVSTDSKDEQERLVWFPVKDLERI